MTTTNAILGVGIGSLIASLYNMQRTRADPQRAARAAITRALISVSTLLAAIKVTHVSCSSDLVQPAVMALALGRVAGEVVERSSDPSVGVGQSLADGVRAASSSSFESFASFVAADVLLSTIIVDRLIRHLDLGYASGIVAGATAFGSSSVVRGALTTFPTNIDEFGAHIKKCGIDGVDEDVATRLRTLADAAQEQDASWERTLGASRRQVKSGAVEGSTAAQRHALRCIINEASTHRTETVVGFTSFALAVFAYAPCSCVSRGLLSRKGRLLASVVVGATTPRTTELHRPHAYERGLCVLALATFGAALGAMPTCAVSHSVWFTASLIVPLIIVTRSEHVDMWIKTLLTFAVAQFAFARLSRPSHATPKRVTFSETTTTIITPASYRIPTPWSFKQDVPDAVEDFDNLFIYDQPQPRFPTTRKESKVDQGVLGFDDGMSTIRSDASRAQSVPMSLASRRLLSFDDDDDLKSSTSRRLLSFDDMSTVSTKVGKHTPSVLSFDDKSTISSKNDDVSYDFFGAPSESSNLVSKVSEVPSPEPEKSSKTLFALKNDEMGTR